MSYPTPYKRRLRVYAFDPSASVSLDTAVINNAVIELPWEKDWEGALDIGPVNDYLEIVDYDPGAGGFYPPVDLNHPSLLAQDGLPPAEASPQFHQQMVFAVAMKTIRNFERALGRPVFWSIPSDDPRVRSARKSQLSIGHEGYPNFVKRLRIYPHALQARNAYFSPSKGALLFGYFRGAPRFAGHEGDWVFTCLSQDIIAHETTHAILHGMRRRGIEASNQDSLAFHEGFADIVALFQHFTMRNVVENEISRTGGVLRSVSLLTGLAGQFGEATGRNGPLRSALHLLGREQQAVDGKTAPKIETLRDAVEAHDRGQYLVAAVFDAFITIYERRTADLFVISGRAPGDRHLPEKLVARLAAEAASIADSMLNMCVRGLDYLPPATTTFGDYLRAIITADIDLVPDDPWNYRIALAESFRKREIPVERCMSYAPSSLAWEALDAQPLARLAMREAGDANALFSSVLKKMELVAHLDEPPEVGAINPENQARPGSRSTGNLRDQAMRMVSKNGRELHSWLARPSATLEAERLWEDLLGIRTLPLEAKRDLNPKSDPNSERTPFSIKSRLAEVDKKSDDIRQLWDAALHGAVPKEPLHEPQFDVHSVRISRRIGPSGNELQQMIAQITQKRRGYFVKEDQDLADANPATLDPSRRRQREVLLNTKDARGNPVERQPDFWFRGGATIIVDLRNGAIQHIVRQRIDNDERLDKQRDFILGDDTALAMTAMTNATDARRQQDSAGAAETAMPVFGLESEPFAFLHADFG